MNVFVIALNTFREAIRDKLLHLLIFFAVLLVIVSRFIGWVSFGGERKITLDLGLTATWLLAMLIAIFVGAGLIYKEIDKRTLYTILSKPIERWEFLLGKYFGLLLTSFAALAFLSAVLILYLWLLGAPPGRPVLQALVLTFFELLVVTALAIFFSSLSTPLLSAIFTFLIFGAGQFTKWVVDLGEPLKAQHPWAAKVLYGIYLLLPNLHNFNVTREAVQAVELGGNAACSAGEMINVMLYGVSYAAALLLLAILVFRRRDF